MKRWTSKKSLRIMIEALREENQELERQLSATQKASAKWEQAAVNYSCDLNSANKRIEALQARLSKFDRQRGPGGKYVKKGE